MGQYVRIEQSIADCERGERRTVGPLAADLTTVALLRPATIPDPSLFLGKLPTLGGPVRETLVEAILALHQMNLVTDEEVDGILADNPSQTVLWCQVSGILDRFRPAWGFHLVDVVITAFREHIPVRMMCQRALEWFDVGAVDAHLMERFARIPAALAGDRESACVLLDLPEMLCELSDSAEAFVQTSSRPKPAVEGGMEDRCGLHVESAGSLERCFTVDCSEFLAAHMGFDLKDVSPAYSIALRLSLDLISCYLRPVCHMGDLMEFAIGYDEEMIEEATEIESRLKELGIDAPKDADIERIIAENNRGMVDAPECYWYAIERRDDGKEMEAQWQMLTGLEETPESLQTCIGTLPDCGNDLERGLKAWLVDVAKALPEKDVDTPYRQLVMCGGGGGGGFLEFHHPILPDTVPELVDEICQHTFENFMQGDEESSVTVGWDVPVTLILEAVENVRVGSVLIDRLCAIEKTPQGQQA